VSAAAVAAVAAAVARRGPPCTNDCRKRSPLNRTLPERSGLVGDSASKLWASFGLSSAAGPGGVSGKVPQPTPPTPRLHIPQAPPLKLPKMRKRKMPVRVVVAVYSLRLLKR
jgi:hypothetical protein